MLKDKLLLFGDWLKSQQRLLINFSLLFAGLLFLPTQNYYAHLDIQQGRPVIRKTDLQVKQFADYPVKQTEEQIPRVSAQSILITDPQSKAIIYAKNPDLPLFPASTTKIMTALVVLEEYQLDEVVQVKESYSVGMGMGLEPGEKLTVESLLKGMLVGSANDAAVVLARHHPQGKAAFVQLMNKKAAEFNLQSTHFTNPTGVDQQNHQTTAHDLVVLTYQAMQKPLFRKLVAVEKTKVSNLGGDFSKGKQKSYDLENINELLGEVKGLKGVKTGWTASAGECLISWTERDGRSILIALFGSKDRFGETELLTEWVFDNFEWEGISNK